MFQTLPLERPARWALVRDFAWKWLEPKPDPTITEDSLAEMEARSGLRLPSAVREWYLLLAETGDLWTGQDKLWFPEDLVAQGEFLPLMVENQDCFRMGIRLSDLGLDDPPVYWYPSNPGCAPLSASVSMFAIQMLIGEAMWSGKHAIIDAAMNVPVQKVAQVVAQFQPCALDDLYLWSFPIRFVCGPQVVFQILYQDGFDDDPFMGFAAASQVAFNETMAYLNSLGIHLEE